MDIRKTDHEFNSIFMIESLPTGECKTGTDLYDGTIAPLTADISGFRIAFRPAETRADFFCRLDELRDRFVPDGCYPILHIEAHGDEDSSGLVLASGEFIGWNELRGHCQQISQRTEFNLLVVTAACGGAHLVKSMRPTERAPFWGVVGPTDTVSNREMQASLEEFYTVLLGTSNGSDALAALNKASAAVGGHYKLLEAETFFCWIYEMHELENTSEEVNTRVNRIVEAWARENVADVRATAIIRQEALARILDHRRWYYHLRDHFLMLDLFPWNEQRFTLSYEQCRERGTKGTSG